MTLGIAAPRRFDLLLIDHLFIIRALILRTVRLRYIRSPAGFVLEFFRPLLSCVAHYFLFWAVNKPMPPGMKLEQFVWAPFIVWLTFNQTYRTVEILHASKPPPLPGVTAMHMRFAHAAWHIVSKGAFCYGSIAIMLLFGDAIPVPNIPLTIYILFVSATLGLGLGMIVEGASRVMPMMEPVFHVLSYVLFLSCGIYFSFAMSPIVVQHVLYWSPLLHLVEYERLAFYPGYPVHLLSLSYPTGWAIGLLLVGLLVNRRLRYTEEVR
jgi:capsular polysaccharide transport system permease protein